jgi:hypothetical protein
MAQPSGALNEGGFFRWTITPATLVKGFKPPRKREILFQEWRKWPFERRIGRNLASTVSDKTEV